MPILAHLIFALSYIALAAVVGLGLPMLSGTTTPSISLLHELITLPTALLRELVMSPASLLHEAVASPTSLLLGAFTLIAGMVAHETISRRWYGRRLTREIAAQRQTSGRVLNELSRARAELKLLHEALEAAARKRTRAPTREIDVMKSEVQMLRRLVDGIVSERGTAMEAVEQRRAVANGGSKSAAITELPQRPGPSTALDFSDTQVLTAVREALSADRVDLYLQPIVSLPQRRRRFFECFSRIRTADGKLLLPSQYLAIAEREGLIAAIDNLLLFRCVQLVRKTQERRFNVGFFCHISPHTLADHTFLKDFTDFMLHNDELSQNLYFEFSQTEVMGRDAGLMRELDRLAAAGFRFSMDQVVDIKLDAADLAARHVAFVKIGAQPILDAVNGQGSMAIEVLKSSLNRHRIDLIVEKVESEPVLLELLDQPVDFGQGYLFGEPRLSRES